MDYYDVLGVQDKKILEELDFKKWDLNTVEISPKKAGELKSLIKKNKNADFLILTMPNESVLDVAVRQCIVDGINAFVKYPMIKLMADKNIALVVSFNDLLNSTKPEKTIFFMRNTIKLAKKYKTPIVITSGAKTKFELRGANELIAFGELIGLRKDEAKKALHDFQEKIIKRQKLIKSGRYVQPGVELNS